MRRETVVKFGKKKVYRKFCKLCSNKLGQDRLEFCSNSCKRKYYGGRSTIKEREERLKKEIENETQALIRRMLDEM